MDTDAVVALQQAWELHWLGRVENDRDEVLEQLVRREHSRLVHDGDALLAAAWWWGNHTALFVRPGSEHLHDEMLAWLESSGAECVEVLEHETVLLETARARGWTHHHSGFELLRDVADLPLPQWPAGVRLTGADDRRAVHDLIYERSRWLEVPGHRFRPYDEWESLNFTPAPVPEHQIACYAGDLVVGVALCRQWSDGAGWVGQLAVDRSWTGRGLGRALLLEGFHRMIATGATGLGLGASAQNRTALDLYLSVGLRVEREWLNHVPPRP